MNKIIIGDYIFTDGDLFSISANLQNGMIGEELYIDILETQARRDAFADSRFIPKNSTGLITADGAIFRVDNTPLIAGLFKYGTPIAAYHDDMLIGQFYVNTMRRTGKNVLSISCFSAIGLLDKLMHTGGVYAGQTAGSLIADILGDIPYTIEASVAAAKVYGWLPYASKRSNLHQILFAIGASITKIDGQMHIKYLAQNSPFNITQDRIYMGGSVEYPKGITSVEVTEHGFYALPTDIEVTLFDNTDGTGTSQQQTIVFENPCHDLVASGLTLVEAGVNHAVVSGMGTLTGKQYTHTRKLLSQPTGLDGEANVAKVENATLVSLLNSDNVAKRLAGYYAAEETVSLDMLVGQERPGDEVTFTDPFGDAQQGFMQSLDITFSGILKGNATFATTWVPDYFGNNFSNQMVITKSGTVNLPDSVRLIRAVLVGGGTGGQAGADGTAGGAGPWQKGIGTPGTGGVGGQAGSPGKVIVLDMDITPGEALTATVGAAGKGGSTNGEIGTSGGDTTLGQYSSASGSVPESGIINLITGGLFALVGANGIAGGDGGTEDEGGASVTYNGVTYAGGANGLDNQELEDPPTVGGWAAGGRGGGAAVGANGTAGTNGTIIQQSGDDTYRGGNGGKGADAAAAISIAANLYGSGGNGGHGGGGGGGGGGAFQSTTNYFADPGSGAAGGKGSAGSDGGSGAIIIYY